MARHSLNSAFTITVGDKVRVVEKVDENEHVIIFSYINNNNDGPGNEVTVYIYDKSKKIFVSSVTVTAEYGQASAFIESVVSNNVYKD